MASRLEKLQAVREFYVAEIERACERHYDQDEVLKQRAAIIEAGEVIRAIDLALPAAAAAERSV